MRTVRLDELTTFDIEGLFSPGEKRMGILLPLGCTEQHGPYLPVGCDTAIARGAAHNLALGLMDSKKYGALVLPDLAYTPSPGAEAMEGTISVSFDFLGMALQQVIGGALKTAWEFVAIINGHAHNHGRVIETSIGGAQGSLGRKVPIVVINIYEFSDGGKSFDLSPSTHAGELEIALYHYYAGSYASSGGIEVWKQPRKRPEKIYGLDILPRSNFGVLSESQPNISKALAVAHNLGKMIDAKILDAFVSNLDTFFSEWRA